MYLLLTYRNTGKEGMHEKVGMTSDKF